MNKKCQYKNCDNKATITVYQYKRSGKNHILKPSEFYCANHIPKLKPLNKIEYDRLSVINDNKLVKNSLGSYMVKCQCSCGNIEYYAKHSIRYGNTTSCGCSKIKTLKNGQKINHFTILDHRLSMNKWQHTSECFCACDCGSSPVWRETSKVKSGAIKSCGCLTYARGVNTSKFKGYGEISLASWSQWKASAKKRHIPFSVSIEEGWELFENQNRRCPYTGEKLEMYCHRIRKSKNNTAIISKGTASLDRIVSSKGYTPDNVQWIHKNLQSMKMDFPERIFFEYCESVIRYCNKNRSKNKKQNTHGWKKLSNGNTSYWAPPKESIPIDYIVCS